MKKKFGIILAVTLILGTMGLVDLPYLGVDKAVACGCAYQSGAPGGGDYVPQQRGQSGSYFDRPALTKEQAYDVVANHLKRFNSDLEIGEIQDAGRFFEAEILSEQNEVIEKLAVDKLTGRIMIIY